MIGRRARRYVGIDIEIDSNDPLITIFVVLSCLMQRVLHALPVIRYDLPNGDVVECNMHIGRVGSSITFSSSCLHQSLISALHVLPLEYGRTAWF